MYLNVSKLGVILTSGTEFFEFQILKEGWFLRPIATLYMHNSKLAQVFTILLFLLMLYLNPGLS